MRLSVKLVASLILAAGASAPAIAADAPLPVQIVDEFNKVYGAHPGYRANHAKGIVVEGEFKPSPTAKTLSSAAHLQDAAVPVTIRFSNAGGLPEAPDTHPTGLIRGMAIKFHLPGGHDTDIVAISINGFLVSNGDDFLALFKAISATKPDSPKPTPLETFLSTHPAAAKILTASPRIPVSYGTQPFYGENAFRFTNAQQKSQFGRYRIVPEAGEAYLSDADAAKQAPNFLADDLRQRLAKGPVKFKLLVQLAAADDPTNDATKVWPDSRPTVELGEITITKAVADSQAAEKKLLFVPTNVTPGIAISDDPLLPLRAAAYGVSYARRSAASAPAAPKAAQ